MEHLAQHVEALIFASSSPISFQEILDCLEATFGTEFSEEELEKAIAEIEQRYEEPTFSFELLKIAGGYNFLTKSAYFSTIGTHLKLTTRKRLSKSALETLSLVAYKQPVTKTEMENIRGVGCDYALQKLLEKELVVIAGRSEGPGRPLLYGTSEKFMDYFGLKSLEDMPKPKDFQMPDNTIGEQAPLEESVPTAVEGEAQGDLKEGEEAKVKLPPIEMTAEEIEASLVEVVPKTEEELLAEAMAKNEEEIVEGIAVGETIELSPEIEGKIEEDSITSETEEKSEAATETVGKAEPTPEVIAEAIPEVAPVLDKITEAVPETEQTVEVEIEAEVVPQIEAIKESVEEIPVVEISPEEIAESVQEMEPISEEVTEVVIEEEQVITAEIEADVILETETITEPVEEIPAVESAPEIIAEVTPEPEQTTEPIVISENEKFEEE